MFQCTPARMSRCNTGNKDWLQKGKLSLFERISLVGLSQERGATCGIVKKPKIFSLFQSTSTWKGRCKCGCWRMQAELSCFNAHRPLWVDAPDHEPNSLDNSLFSVVYFNPHQPNRLDAPRTAVYCKSMTGDFNSHQPGRASAT
jgi:hypothetical protein